MLPWCIHFVWQRKKREKERNFKVKIQQAAANNIISSSTCFFVGWFFKMLFFFKEPADKKTKIGGKKWRSYYRCTKIVTNTYQGRFGKPRTSRGGTGCKLKAATTRTDASHTCVLLRSCRDVRFPRHLPNAKTAAIFQSHPDGTTKKQISYFGDPQTGKYTNFKLKNRKTM